MEDTTLNELADFFGKEDKFHKLFPEKEVLTCKPGKQVIANILNYSKSLDVRNTKSIGKQLFILN